MHVTTAVVRLALVAAGATTLILAPVATGQRSSRPGADVVRPQLVKVVEMRKRDLVKSDGPSFDFVKPGLTLTFDMNLPSGAKFASLEQPAILEARDSRGTDLSKIEAGFSGQKEYVSVASAFNEPPSEIEVHLANPSRSADTFSVSTVVEAQVFSKTQTVRLHSTNQVSDVPAATFGTGGYTVVAQPQSGQTQVTIAPGDARDLIETISIVSGSMRVESNGSMWSDDSITYFFDAKAGPELDLEIEIRRGIKTLPIEIQLTDIPLP